jgi:hypothetical protein
MPRCHLSCGGSTRGPVGLCGTVLAPNKRRALVLFRRALQNGKRRGVCATRAYGVRDKP